MGVGAAFAYHRALGRTAAPVDGPTEAVASRPEMD